jgi:hypothetical protein
MSATVHAAPMFPAWADVTPEAEGRWFNPALTTSSEAHYDLGFL